MKLISRWRLAAVVVLSLAVPGAIVAAQTARSLTGPLAPFGVSEATVRTQLLDSVSGGGEISNRLVLTIEEGYQRIPVAMRGAATSAAFAWARSYVSSPAFTALYAKYRDEHRPAGAAITESLDDEVQKRIAATILEFEGFRTAFDGLDPATRAQGLKNIDDEIARYKSPEMLRAMRLAVAAERSARNEDSSHAAAEFAEQWPADPKVYVKKQLERFMSATASIDYSLPQIWIKDPAGKTAGFLSPGLEDIPWQTLHAIVAGREAVDAARGAVSVWLKELP